MKIKKVKKINKKVQEAATKLLKLFGQDGKHWLNGAENDEKGNYCLIGGLEQLGYNQTLLDPVLPIQDVDANDESDPFDLDFQSFIDTPNFNDRDGWKPIKTFLKLLKKGVNPNSVFIDEDGNAKVIEVKTLKV